MFWIVLYIDISPSWSQNVSDTFLVIKFYIAIGFLFTMLHIVPHIWVTIQITWSHICGPTYKIKD
jgi:hypothetical protein